MSYVKIGDTRVPAVWDVFTLRCVSCDTCSTRVEDTLRLCNRLQYLNLQGIDCFGLDFILDSGRINKIGGLRAGLNPIQFDGDRIYGRRLSQDDVGDIFKGWLPDDFGQTASLFFRSRMQPFARMKIYQEKYDIVIILNTISCAILLLQNNLGRWESTFVPPTKSNRPLASPPFSLHAFFATIISSCNMPPTTNKTKKSQSLGFLLFATVLETLSSTLPASLPSPEPKPLTNPPAVDVAEARSVPMDPDAVIRSASLQHPDVSFDEATRDAISATREVNAPSFSMSDLESASMVRIRWWYSSCAESSRC